MTELPDWARRLDLSPHPEGGWFRETWRSELTVRPVRAAAGLHGPAQRRNRDPVPAHARPAVGLAHGAQRRTVALSPRQPAAAGGRARTGRCDNALLGATSRRRAPAVVVRPGTGSGPAPATTNPGWSAAWWCQDSTSPTSRSRRLPTEQVHRCGHQRGVVRRRRTVGQRQRVLHADAGLHAAHPGVFQ